VLLEELGLGCRVFWLVSAELPEEKEKKNSALVCFYFSSYLLGIFVITAITAITSAISGIFRSY
jgi:penicillin V acylase-like amidase (Ntn superfamily)